MGVHSVLPIGRNLAGASPASKRKSRAFMAVLSLLLVSTTLSAQTTLFSETFNEANLSTSGTSAEGISWSSTPTSTTGSQNSEVNGGLFENRNITTTWISSGIDVSNYTALSFATDFAGDSDNDADDCIQWAVKIDGVSVASGSACGSSPSNVSGIAVSDGSTAVIEFTGGTNNNKEYLYWDNVTLVGTLNCTDTDGDGICEDGTDLCTNTSACNYDGSLYANAACLIPGACDSCSGGAIVGGDSDNDGICNGADNCSDLGACNYDDVGNGSCT